jgi:SAM-dependent methyltransferase
MARFGDLRRTAPLTEWGEGRGRPVDRWYIERYLRSHAALVHGRVLEVKSDLYASSLGAAAVDVLDIDADNAQATVVGDVCDPGTLPAGSYDAVVFTQTLQLVPDPAAALRNLLTSLRPGGVLLLSVPCLSPRAAAQDLWRWTPQGLGVLLSGVVPHGARVEVRGMGNGLTGRAFLFGLAAEDLPEESLQVDDLALPVVAGALAQLPE